MESELPWILKNKPKTNPKEYKCQIFCLADLEVGRKDVVDITIKSGKNNLWTKVDSSFKHGWGRSTTKQMTKIMN